MVKDDIAVASFCCSRDGLNIRGQEYLPEGRDLTAIIFSHGFGGNGREFASYCEKLASWGYAAYHFDFCGGGVESQSDGSSMEMTVETECRDLETVLAYVRGLPYIDEEKIVLIGGSQGGLVSALTAVSHGKDIAALVLLYPALCIPDDARRGALAGSSYDIHEVPEEIDCAYLKISRAYHEAVVNMRPYELIGNYQGRVLILHGTDDEMVHPHYSVRAKECYENAHLELIKGAGHGFTAQEGENALVSIRQFLLQRQEILTIDVQIIGKQVRREGYERQVAIFFMGTCDTPYFKGEILPGAEDVQDFEGDQCVSMRAEYTLEGVDDGGQQCQIHIVNREVDGEWKPTAETDSGSLAFLNGADLTAALESFEGGLTVRIFVDSKYLQDEVD